MKYTTVAQVKAMIADKVSNVTSDADIQVFIEQAEGIVDTILKIGTDGNAFTFSTLKYPHRVIELCVTSMAAAITLGASSDSQRTTNEAVLIQQLCEKWYVESLKLIGDSEFGKFILKQ